MQKNHTSLDISVYTFKFKIKHQNYIFRCTVLANLIQFSCYFETNIIIFVQQKAFKAFWHLRSKFYIKEQKIFCFQILCIIYLLIRRVINFVKSIKKVKEGDGLIKDICFEISFLPSSTKTWYYHNARRIIQLDWYGV